MSTRDETALRSAARGIDPLDIRIGDAERADTVRDLERHLAAGRLNVEEYDQRTALAYASRTRRELRELVRDLPPLDDVRSGGGDAAGAHGPATGLPAARHAGADAPPEPAHADRTRDDIVPVGGPGSRTNVRDAVMLLSIAVAPCILVAFDGGVKVLAVLIPLVTAILLYVAHAGPDTWHLTADQRLRLTQLRRRQKLERRRYRAMLRRGGIDPRTHRLTE